MRAKNGARNKKSISLRRQTCLSPYYISSNIFAMEVATKEDEDKSTEESDRLTSPKVPYLRYWIVFLATTVMAQAIACSFAFNFAVVCRVNGSIDAEAVYMQDPRNSDIMYFDNSMVNRLYSAYPFGIFWALLFIIGWKGYQRISVRYSVFVSSIMSAILTLIIPPMYDFDSRSSLILKILQGAMVAPTVPLVGYITTFWAPRTEIGMFVSILTSYSQIGLFFLMSTCGFLCDSFGWRSIFYFHGVCGIVVSILWLIVYTNSPKKHQWISQKELDLIGTHHITKEKEPIPFREMFTNMSIWACLVACIGNYNGVSPFIVFAAQIMKKALNLSDLLTSQFNSASFALQLILKLISGKLGDVWSTDETLKLRFFNTISCGLCGVLICATAFIPAEHKYACAIMMVLFQGIIGFNAAGFNKAAVVVARQHAHFLLTCYGLILTFSTLCEPFLVGEVAPESTWSEWFPLFLGHGALLILSNVFFCVFIEGRPAAFTEDKKDTLLQEQSP